MLDQVIDNIIANIHKEVVTPQMDQIPLNYLMTRNIPNSVKHFFNQEVEIWLREESDKFSASERFDYDIPEVRVLIDKIFDVLKLTATFHLNKFNQLLERAIKLEANYLIRPHQTLTQFLFKDSKVVTTMEVYDMLKYFDKLQYYKDALTDYFNLKYLREINQNQFEELIAGIDQQVFSKDRLNATLQTVKAIVNFLNEGRDVVDTIPVDILQRAFEDRNLDDFLKLLKAEEKKGTQEFSFSNLEALLRTGKGSEKKVEELIETPEFKVEEVQDIEEAKPEIQVEEINVEASADLPEMEEFEDELEEEEEEEEEFEEEPKEAAKPSVEPFEEEIEAEAPPESPVEEEIETEEYISEEVEEKQKPKTAKEEEATAADQLADMVSEKIKGDRLDDINAIISSKNRKKIVKKIFKKDERRYMKFISFLNEIPSWKKASAAIDEMFYQTGVNPYSSIAIEFSDMIYNRYFPKDKMLNRQEFQ
ncbi:MAG: hypothetical protein P8Y60_02435 [Calditrichota bacterium]|jgi:hypothetical protein